MHAALSSWQKNSLRLLAWGCLLTIVWAVCQSLALAQERTGVVEEVLPAGETSFMWELFGNLFNSRGLMETLGKPQYTIAAFVALNVIVFVETGLLLGFFLPGDSLLVTAGIVCFASGWPLPWLLLTLSVSAIVGDSVGYSIGFKTGPKIFNREKSFFFHKDHLLAARRFYEQHGGKTIMLARFMPIIRTFAPVVAGVGKMEYRRFLFFNILGGIGWVVSMILIGYFLTSFINPWFRWMLGNPDFDVKDHVEKVIIIVVFLSITPGMIAWLQNKFGGKRGTPSTEGSEPALSGQSAK